MWTRIFVLFSFKILKDLKNLEIQENHGNFEILRLQKSISIPNQLTSHHKSNNNEIKFALLHLIPGELSTNIQWKSWQKFVVNRSDLKLLKIMFGCKFSQQNFALNICLCLLYFIVFFCILLYFIVF